MARHGSCGYKMNMTSSQLAHKDWAPVTGTRQQLYMQAEGRLTSSTTLFHASIQTYNLITSLKTQFYLVLAIQTFCLTCSFAMATTGNHYVTQHCIQFWGGSIQTNNSMVPATLDWLELQKYQVCLRQWIT